LELSALVMEDDETGRAVAAEILGAAVALRDGVKPETYVRRTAMSRSLLVSSAAVDRLHDGLTVALGPDRYANLEVAGQDMSLEGMISRALTGLRATRH
ncbi:MAG: hypothetical protein LC792_10565, partial [Actinobacteria bacterium]|nr:hypothetical protein [Actinomycetota bacterium]